MSNTRPPIICALFVVLMLVITNSVAVNTYRNPSADEMVENRIENNADVKIAQSGTRIYNGVQTSGYLTGDEDYDVYYIVVGASAISMRAVLDGPVGDDYDLYGKHGSVPTTSVYDWRGFSTDAYEDVTHPYPSSGIWYFLVRSYSGSGSFYLTVTIDSAGTFTSETTFPETSTSPETTTPPETSSEPPLPNGYVPISPTLILGVAGVGVVLVVAVIAFLYIRKRGTDSGPEPFEVVFPDSY